MTKAAHMGGSGQAPAPSDKAKPSKTEHQKATRAAKRKAQRTYKKLHVANEEKLQGSPKWLCELDKVFHVASRIANNVNQLPEVKLVAARTMARVADSLVKLEDVVHTQRRLQAIEKKLGLQPGTYSTGKIDAD